MNQEKHLMIRLRRFFKHSKIALLVCRWGGKSLFIFGILLYLFAQIGLLHLPTILERSTPAEPDDAYSYILKSPQMQSCFWQDCSAIEDLQQQLSTPSSDNRITWERDRQYHRIIRGYHPLYSIVLAGFYAVGFSWENAYNAITIIGAIFIGLAISYWLYSIFGYGPAGVAMLLLAFTFFEGQGLHHIVPSNLALGIAMLAWGIIAQAGRRHRWLLPVCIFALLTIHPIGKVYAAVTLAAYVLLIYPSRSKQTWIIIGICVFLIAVSFGLSLVATRPALSPLPGLQNLNGWEKYWINVDTAVRLIRKWINTYRGSLLTVGAVLLIGFLSISGEQRRTVLVMGGILLILLIGGLLYVYPGYQAIMVPRVWVPISIFLTAIIGQATWGLLGFVYRLNSHISLVQREINHTSSFNWGRYGRNLAIVLLVAAGVRFGQHTVSGYHKFNRMARHMSTYTNVALDPAQPAILLSEAYHCKSVLYMNETPLYFFLSYGAYQCGAVFYRAVSNTPEEKTWIDNNKNIRHLVAWNPTVELSTAREGGVALMPGEGLEFNSTTSEPLKSVYFYLENRGGETTLDVQVGNRRLSESRTVQVLVPARWSGWLQCPSESYLAASTINLEIGEAEDTILLKGFRTDRHSSLNWPWEQGFSLTHRSSETKTKSRTIHFTSAGLNPFSDRTVHVIADGGSTVLAEVVYK